ncbi:hypothetical protein [Flavitalea sp.]|nr:hypothetical protein [Flavitalea sp.]
MAEEQIDIKVISRKNSGFPEWLDFEKLRTEGIDYLGRLSGKIWTDHNVHDPGITILEVLCYALMDLGYRANLPVEEIFARDPENTTRDDNFLTPSQVLTNNPLTITDFRKLLIDIKGINNAWLAVATDQDPNVFCPPDEPEPEPDPNNPEGGTILLHVPAGQDPYCTNYLNGLYHVYLDLEVNLEKEYRGRPNEKKKYTDCLIEKVSKALMEHRNICEDFIDIKILCKWEIGVCAEIEIEDNADPESVYLGMVDKLREFFSPSPRFYTLQQLLDANKTMDEIFAGRPYDVTESHGFVDVAELEALKFRKSIHVSDVYGALFSVKGIKKIQRLRLRNCTGSKSIKTEEWVVNIPEDHVPDFSVECSGFEFNRAGISVSFDFRKYDGLLEVNFQHNGKILYTAPSDKLDSEIPKGFYHKELGTYISIQNDFPRVYGIAEGGLSDKVSPLRKAQALQLKGYLLFFDQLLANYLSQLKNMRSLFSLSIPANDSNEGRHTYFSSLPGAVPGFGELVRYKVDETSIPSGETGYLAFPVSKKYLKDLADQGKLRQLEIDSVPNYRFTTASEKDTAISSMMEDFFNEVISVEYVVKNDECVYYYILSSSDDYALIGRKYYKNEQAARESVASLRYAASVRSNYRSSTMTSPPGFSFSVELNISTYANFLQALIEDEALYRKRRHSFLNHLLSRFAERFTDYALLSYGFYTDEVLQGKDIEAKERFLSNLPLLTSTRGKAFDYLADGWYSDNNAGFEKRMRALLGHEELKRKSLCNFAVYAYDETYMFSLSLGDDISFKSSEKFETRETASKAAAKLLDALTDRANYRTDRIARQNDYLLRVNYGSGKEAVFSKTYSSPSIAESVSDGFQKMMMKPESKGQLEIASYRHSASLRDTHEQTVRVLSESSLNPEEIKKVALKAIGKVNDPGTWKQGEKPVEKIGKLIANPDPQKPLFVDRDEYKVDVDNTIVGKPDKFNFELLDKNHRFKFLSINEFDKKKDATDACLQVLSLMTDADNIVIEEDPGFRKWSIYVTEKQNKLAVSSWVMDSHQEAKKVVDQINEAVQPTVYHLTIDAVPDSWNFKYELGYEPGEILTVQSVQTYPGEAEARSALVDFSSSLVNSTAEKTNSDWVINTGGSGKKSPLARFINLQPQPFEDPESALPYKVLELQKKVNRLSENRDNPETFASYVDVHEDSKCRYVYHLVDKDALYAVRTSTTTTKSDAEKLRKDSIQKNIEDYNFLELYMKGEKIVVERSGTDGKTKWYHYRISSLNLIKSPIGGIDQKIVLFESTKGFPNREEAEAAFLENYMKILTLGLDLANYGEGKPISETPILIQIEDICISTESMVYVPAETLKHLGTYPQQSIAELIRVVQSYPIRSIRKIGDKEKFDERFLPCKKEEVCKVVVPEDCAVKKEKPVYFFVLYDKATDQEDWQSPDYFDSADEAMKAFRFFLLLLKYEGNYFIDCDCTGLFKIYIREVLAESLDRFMNEELAWGKDGIQHFINVSQTEDAFHAYVDDYCCNRFFVACKNIRIVHPCKFDTPEIRDNVIRELQKFAPQLLKWKFDTFCDTVWKDILVDLEGNPLAHVNFRTEGGVWSPDDILEGYIGIISYIGRYPLCIDEDKNEVYLNIDTNHSIHFTQTPGSGINSLEELRNKLLWLACYFPFTNKESGKSSTGRNVERFCIEIRLPGFNPCADCNGNEGKPEELCPLAWISECCFGSCDELIAAFKIIVNLLQHFRLYLPVFDCKCGPYGIELYDVTSRCIDEMRHPDSNTNNANTISLNRIVARNPQCYPGAEIMCEAITRSKKLINSEGLHLVEHILLRPRCPEDCECVLEPCPNPFDDCKFPYWDDLDDEDPCDTRKPVCFQPGHDPYSFIATVALPAWPERFRKKESRAIIENMLHREAPAHVALRVLWLTPHDLCCFEQQYKRWLIWIAYKKSCLDNYKTCDFVNFLFHREFECWIDRPACDNCEDPIEEDSCVQRIKDEEGENNQNKCRPQKWTEQINELFCWKDKNCSDSFYLPCEEPVVEINNERSAKLKTREKPKAKTPVKQEKSKEAPETKIPGEKERAVEEPADVIDPPKKTSKTKFVNSRLAAYRRELDSIVEKSKGNDLMLRARRFLDSGSASSEEYNKLLTELNKAWDKAKAKKTESKKLFDIISNITRFYLDKLLFNGGVTEELSELRTKFLSMRKKGMNTGNIYKSWQPGIVQEYQPELDFANLEKIIKG